MTFAWAEPYKDGIAKAVIDRGKVGFWYWLDRDGSIVAKIIIQKNSKYISYLFP